MVLDQKHSENKEHLRYSWAGTPDPVIAPLKNNGVPLSKKAGQ